MTMATGLEQVTTLLGEDAFLVPCIRGTKVPAVTYTQRPFEATQTPAYRYALASGEFNIAVYLGQMSGGLCAMDFDRDEDLAAFLAVNRDAGRDDALARQPRRHGLGADRGRLSGRAATRRTSFEWRAKGGFRRSTASIRRGWITPCWWTRRR